MFDNYDVDKTDSISLWMTSTADIFKAGRGLGSAEAPKRAKVAVRVQTARDVEAEGDVPQLHVTAQPKSRGSREPHLLRVRGSLETREAIKTRRGSQHGKTPRMQRSLRPGPSRYSGKSTWQPLLQPTWP